MIQVQYKTKELKINSKAKMEFLPLCITSCGIALWYLLAVSKKPSTTDIVGANNVSFNQIGSDKPTVASELKFIVNCHYNLNSRPSCGMYY